MQNVKQGYFLSNQKKSRIWETKHLSTDADSSTDTTVGWTKNIRKPNFFEKRKKSSQTRKLKKLQRYANISDIPFDQRSLIHWEVWFPPCFVRQNQPKKNLFFLLILLYKTWWKPRFPMDQRPLVEGYIANVGISLDVFEFFRFGLFFLI